MNKSFDVVVVGGGIAGGAMAHVLARAGLSVLVLERQHSYRDRVRGEYIPPWGVRELQQLGLQDILLAAGGRYVSRFVAFDEALPPEAAERRGDRIAQAVDGVPGSLNVGHPQACEALNLAARAAGAEVLSGVTDIRLLTTSPWPELCYVHDGREQKVEARFLIGADGRQSIVRKQLGLDLREYAARTVAAGLLVRQATDNPAQPSIAGTFGDAFYLAFPRADGVARLYVMLSIAERQRFAGQQGAQRLLESFNRYGSPFSAQLSAAQPIGPCATYAMNDSLVQQPIAENAALIGDAAGWNDPIIGQGISTPYATYA